MKDAKQQSSEELLGKIARKTVELRLETPVVFFLEVHIPFTTIFHTGTLLLAPIATPLFGADRVGALQTLLADRGNVERLIDLIETHAALRDGALKVKGGA